MLSPKRLFFWTVLLAFLLSGNSAELAYDEELEDEPVHQRRELWDFFSFLSLRKCIWKHSLVFVPASVAYLYPPCSVFAVNLLNPRCNHPDGTRDWGPKNGPKWLDCSRQEAWPTMAPAGSGQSSYVYTQSSSYNQNDSNKSTGSGKTDSKSFNPMAAGFQLWMVFAAGSVVSALIAINLGQRKDPVGLQRHGMAGAVMRRVGAVSAFAAGAFPARGKAVEMQATRPEYKLDLSPTAEDASIHDASV